MMVMMMRRRIVMMMMRRGTRRIRGRRKKTRNMPADGRTDARKDGRGDRETRQGGDER